MMTKRTLPTIFAAMLAMLAMGVMVMLSTPAQAGRTPVGRILPDMYQQLRRDLAARGVPEDAINKALFRLGFALLRGGNAIEVVNGVTTVATGGEPIAGKENCRSGGVGFKRVGSTKDFDVLTTGVWCWTDDGWTTAANHLRGEMEQASTSQQPQSAASPTITPASQPGTTVTAAIAADLSVQGLTFGMSPEEARSKIGNGFTFSSAIASGRPEEVLLAGETSGQRFFSLDFFQNKLVFVAYHETYSDGSKPTYDNMVQAIKEKYGPSGLTSRPAPSLQMEWFFGKDGSPLDTRSRDDSKFRCSIVVQQMVPPETKAKMGLLVMTPPVKMPVPAKWEPNCDKRIVVDVGLDSNNDKLVSTYDIQMIDQRPGADYIDAEAQKKKRDLDATTSAATVNKPRL